jgi:hypothetical protein
VPVISHGPESGDGVLGPTLNTVPAQFTSKNILNFFSTEFRIKIRITTENVEINLTVFWVCVRREVTLGQHKNTRHPDGLELVESLAYHMEIAQACYRLHSGFQFPNEIDN